MPTNYGRRRAGGRTGPPRLRYRRRPPERSFARSRLLSVQGPLSSSLPTRLACPLCGADDAAVVKEFDDGVVVGRCRSCGLLYTPVPHPTPSRVLAPTSADELRGVFAEILEGRRHHNRRRNFLDYLAIVSRHAPGRRLLDVGCAHGFLGRAARERGWTVTGVEPNEGMAEFAREVNGLEVLRGTLAEVELGSRRFDVVTLTDVLEYIPDPLGALATLRSHLDPGGIVFLKVPNGRSFHFRHRAPILPGGGDTFTPSRRVVHYTEESLTRLVRAAGLEVVAWGAPRPVHSPAPARGGAPWQELEPRWYEFSVQRMLRTVVHHAGRTQAALTGRNDLSPSLYVVGRLPA